MAQGKGLIVSVSGIRGIVGDSLTPEAATAFAAALGSFTDGGRIVVGRDGRPSGEMLRHAVLAGLLGAGCDVHDLGVAATPTVGLAVRRLEAAGGIQITASHNPASWNGLKLFGPDGRVLSAAVGRRFQAVYDARDFRRAGWEGLGRQAEGPDAADWHLRRVLELVDGPAIRARRLCALLDANGGAGGPLGRRLLEALEVRAVCLGAGADGAFAHEPEPIAANLAEVAARVPREGAQVGFAIDPDADRLALIDEKGRYVGEELTLALAVQFRLRQEPAAGRGPVVINMSTSRVVEDIARQYGVPCHRAAVGEANVADLMIEVGSLIGGEGNGGVMDPRVGYVRDPFIGMALVLNLMAETRKPLSELVDALPAYAIVKDKASLPPERLPGLFHQLEKRWPEARLNRQDGLRIDLPDRWVHVRPSNTEPIVRVIAEAPRQEDAAVLCRDTLALARNN